MDKRSLIPGAEKAVTVWLSSSALTLGKNLGKGQSQRVWQGRSSVFRPRLPVVNVVGLTCHSKLNTHTLPISPLSLTPQSLVRTPAPMLPDAHRLRQSKDFSAVYRRGIRRNSPHLTLRGLWHFKNAEFAVSDPLRPTRIGISISQKVSKRSVIRNRIKRQLRAALRQLLPRLSPGWDLVFVVRQTAQECKYAEFLQELEQLLVEAEVLDGNSRRSLL